MADRDTTSKILNKADLVALLAAEPDDFEIYVETANGIPVALVDVGRFESNAVRLIPRQPLILKP